MSDKFTENHYILGIIWQSSELRISVGGLYGIQFHHGRKERENLCVSIVSRGSEIVKSYEGGGLVGGLRVAHGVAFVKSKVEFGVIYFVAFVDAVEHCAESHGRVHSFFYAETRKAWRKTFA